MPHRCEIGPEAVQDIVNIETGLLAPLSGFMSEADCISVVDTMQLADGETAWTIPVTLDIPEELAQIVQRDEIVELLYCGHHVADLKAASIFKMEEAYLQKIFLTLDDAHPGVAKERKRSPWRLGGETWLKDSSLLEDALQPSKTKDHFTSMGWKTVVGFQTRNPIHTAHEHLQRLGLELCDGLFINPITGWKKPHDFTEEAVIAAYETMIDQFYPRNRVYLAGLKTQMRYAGPREAIFHATIRKNLGCTHFIIGRDHAGVGNYYGAYDAHKLARELMERYDLGVQLLLFNEPYYCNKCGFVVSNKTCKHEQTHKTEISGTIIRRCMQEKSYPPEDLIRPEIVETLFQQKTIFIEE